MIMSNNNYSTGSSSAFPNATQQQQQQSIYLPSRSQPFKEPILRSSPPTSSSQFAPTFPSAISAALPMPMPIPMSMGMQSNGNTTVNIAASSSTSTTNSTTTKSKSSRVTKSTNNRGGNKARAPGKHKCDQCDKVFTRNWNLKLHYEINHLKVPPRHCSICGKAFNRKSDMNRHIKEIHLGRQRYQLNTTKRTGKGSATGAGDGKDGAVEEKECSEGDIRLILTKSARAHHKHKHTKHSTTAAVTANTATTNNSSISTPNSLTAVSIRSPLSDTSWKKMTMMRSSRLKI
ncbi:unnamed protein product [Ambrosiozyma monospora]|uniref:Unnamed protein product n=1 Tax=Ambrosiozyma monospora TaxID=43982 RepID=A0ACB5U903_AMBMO|nr:unnamed protein product [Ambrosiozyma monospora]